MYGIKKQTSCSGLPARLFSFVITKHCVPCCVIANIQTWQRFTRTIRIERQNSMNSKTEKQKKQEEEYKKWKRSQGEDEDLFAKKPGVARRKNLFERKCSVCGSPQAWRSSDFGRTWQCFAHAKD